MILRALATTFALTLILLSACIPGSDRGDSVRYSGEGSEVPLEERSSDWFLHNKTARLPYDPLPHRTDDGALPRSIGTYSLLGVAPDKGKEYRDGQKIYYVEEITKNRRMRVFNRDGLIFRLQAFTRLTDLPESAPDELVLLIKEQYGQPDHEFPDELTYVDEVTVVQFSISNDFLVTDLMDISTCELPVHILEIVDKNRQTP